MKITKSYLKQVIMEEVSKELQSEVFDGIRGKIKSAFGIGKSGNTTSQKITEPEKKDPNRFEKIFIDYLDKVPSSSNNKTFDALANILARALSLGIWNEDLAKEAESIARHTPEKMSAEDIKRILDSDEFAKRVSTVRNTVQGAIERPEATSVGRDRYFNTLRTEPEKPKPTAYSGPGGYAGGPHANKGGLDRSNSGFRSGDNTTRDRSDRQVDDDRWGHHGH